MLSKRKLKKMKSKRYDLAFKEKQPKPEIVKDWKTTLPNGYYEPLLSDLANDKVSRYKQEINDLPPSILVDGDKCNLHLYYDKKDEEDKWPWHIKYVDENGNARLENSSITHDWAISNMMNTIRHHGFGKDKVTDLEGHLYRHFCLNNKHEYSIVSKIHKLKPYKYNEDGMIDWNSLNACPYCDSNNVKTEYFKSSPESWAALAGREGYDYVCEDCGYRWQDIICMS